MEWRLRLVASLGLALGCIPVAADDTGAAGASDEGSTGAAGTTTAAAEDDTAAPGTSASPTTDAVADSESGSPQCPGDPACAETVLRFATWNTLRVGPVGSAEYEALLAIVLRLDADVLCLQEVGEGEEPQLQALATAAGYHDGILTPASGPPGIGIANACMSRLDTLDAAYLWSDWISSDATARDLTRPFVRLRIRDDATGRYVSVLSGHLKAGTDDVDRFRRMVEFIRLGQAATAERDDFPGNAVVVLGDFNETPNPQSSTFSSLPSDLPSFYNLGNDIALPLTYAPAEPLQAAGLTRVEARWEDGTEEDTFIPFANRLDYIYVSDEEVLASEVYEACRDDGIDAEPVGDVLDKVGAPLDCGLSEVASDHRPVIVELVLR